MKKISIILILGLIFFAYTTHNVFASDPVVINLDESNQPTIFPHGSYVYATVTLEEYTSCTSGKTGVKITVAVNKSVLVPGTKFGIKEFAFNYYGGSSLTIATPPSWNTAINVTVPPFGTFSYDVSAAVANRQDPLVLTICSTNDLSVWDFIKKNNNNPGYAFAAFINGFVAWSTITSGYFATQDIPDPPPPPTTTTTSVLQTTTTTSIDPTTTTTSIDPTTTTTSIDPTTTTTSINSTTTTTSIIPPPPTTTTSVIATTTTTQLKTTTTTGPPELIKLSSFTAIPGNREVTLVWVTESEIDNAGFNVYRAEAEEGEYIKINNAFIPAEGNSGGATYQFVDKGLWNRETYYYKLEDIDLWDKSTLHGPEKATPRFMYGILNKLLDKMVNR